MTQKSAGDTPSEPPYAEGPSISGTWESIKELNSALNREMESKYAYLQILENIAKECGVDTSKSPPEGALAALIAVQRLAAQLREVTAERDALREGLDRVARGLVAASSERDKAIAERNVAHSKVVSAETTFVNLREDKARLDCLESLLKGGRLSIAASKVMLWKERHSQRYDSLPTLRETADWVLTRHPDASRLSSTDNPRESENG